MISMHQPVWVQALSPAFGHAVLPLGLISIVLTGITLGIAMAVMHAVECASVTRFQGGMEAIHASDFDEPMKVPFKVILSKV